MKKISKDYIACKAGNLKKTLSGKNKKSSDVSTDSSNTKKIGESAKNFGNTIKDKMGGLGKFLTGFGPKKN